jgi:hypothetical protein
MSEGRLCRGVCFLSNNLLLSVIKELDFKVYIHKIIASIVILLHLYGIAP